ncbi:hypothetical protein NSTCB13_05307 [Nostoc sp. DSM 114160]|jgi:hypothetical protein
MIFVGWGATALGGFPDLKHVAFEERNPTRLSRFTKIPKSLDLSMESIQNRSTERSRSPKSQIQNCLIGVDTHGARPDFAE